MKIQAVNGGFIIVNSTGNPINNVIYPSYEEAHHRLLKIKSVISKYKFKYNKNK